MKLFVLRTILITRSLSKMSCDLNWPWTTSLSACHFIRQRLPSSMRKIAPRLLSWLGLTTWSLDSTSASLSPPLCNRSPTCSTMILCGPCCWLAMATPTVANRSLTCIFASATMVACSICTQSQSPCLIDTPQLSFSTCWPSSLTRYMLIGVPKLISMSSDGERTMIGHLRGLVTLIVACAENNMLRIWCPPHQIDIVVKSTTETSTPACGSNSPTCSRSSFARKTTSSSTWGSSARRRRIIGCT